MDICYRTSNNKYSKLPPRMADGRHFTDYRPNCLVNGMLIKNNSINTNRQYQKFLVNNAQKLMELNWTYACQKNCSGDYKDEVNIPSKYEIKCDKNNCEKKIKNPLGVGTVINYGNSTIDYNCRYSINKDLPENCCISNKDKFNYFY